MHNFDLDFTVSLSTMPIDSLKNNSGTGDRITAIKENDEGVLKLFYQANYPKVESYVLSNNGTADEAKDIYQEAFIAVWRNIKLDRFSPQSSTSLEGYLYQVAKNKWLDYLRTIKKRKLVSLTDETGELNEMEDQLLSSEWEQQQLNSIQMNLKMLGNTCREVLNLFYYQKQSIEKISIKMNWTNATAKNNKYRCLQSLRELLKKNKVVE